jgi:hypothetical protein
VAVDRERFLHRDDLGLQVFYQSTLDKTDENHENIQVRIICFRPYIRRK